MNNISSISASSECSWLTPTDTDNDLQCVDGTFCNWITDPEKFDCCKDHGGRAKCPKSYPNMCAKDNDCVDGTDYCCEKQPENCDGDKEGLRACDSSTGISIFTSITRNNIRLI